MYYNFNAKINTNMSKPKRTDRSLFGVRNACTKEYVNFKIKFEGSVRVDKFQVKRIPNRTTPGEEQKHSETTGGKSNVDSAYRAKLALWSLGM